MCGGEILEDQDGYGRLHDMLHMLISSNKQVNDGIEGFGDGETVGVAASCTVYFTLKSGILNQNITIEIIKIFG